MSTAVRTRRYELDHLRVVATLGVISLHVAAIVVVAYKGSRPDLLSQFNLGNAANTAGRFAVNCFFMTSGALLLDPVRRFVLRPQFLRVALPTLTWIVLYALVNTALNASDRPGVRGALKDPLSPDPTELVRALLAGPAVYHLWFVYVLLGIYLVVPLLRALTDRPEPQRRQLLLWFLTLWLLADLLPRWGAFLLGERFPVLYAMPLSALPVGYVGLFVLGFVISHYRDRLRVPTIGWALVAAAGFAWTFTDVWLAAHAGEARVFVAYDNLLPPVLLLSIGVFGLFATRAWGPGPAWPFVSRFSQLSFRVYLVHIMVLHTLRVTTDLGPLLVERPAVGIPAMFLATVTISLLVSWLLDLVPPLRRWI